MAPVRGRGNWPFRKHERNVVDCHDSIWMIWFPESLHLYFHAVTTSIVSKFPLGSACTAHVRCQQMGSAFHSSKSPEDNSTATTPCTKIREEKIPMTNNPKGQAGNGFENPEFVETLSLSPHIANLQQQQGWRHAPAIKIIKMSIIRTASEWRHGWFSFYHMMSTWWSCWSNTLIQPFISMCPRHHLLWQQKSKARDQSGWLLQVQWLRCAPFPWRSAGQFFRLLKRCHAAEVSMMWFIELSKDSTPSTWTLSFLRSFRPDLSFYL